MAGLNHQPRQLVKSMNDLRQSAQNRFQLFYASVDRCRRLKREVGRGSFALLAELTNQRLSPGIEKVLHASYLGRIFVVRAALETRRQAHLHLGVDTAGESGIRIKTFDAAAHLEEIQRIIHELLGRDARDERTVVQVLSASFTEPGSDRRPRIFVVQMQLHERRKSKTQALPVSLWKCRAQDPVEQEAGFEV